MTYTGVTPGQWESLDLTQDATDSTLWTGTLSDVTPGQVEFVVQAVNGVGLVSLDDNQGAYYRPGQIPPALQSNPAPLTHDPADADRAAVRQLRLSAHALGHADGDGAGPGSCPPRWRGRR